MSSEPIIGIDLGTTYAGAAVFTNDWLRMVSDLDGNIIIPTMVAFSERGTIVGNDVRYQLASNAENSIYDAKRFIGRSYSDQWVKSSLKEKPWPFQIVNYNHKVYFKITANGDNQRYLPEQISAIILKTLKTNCEINLGQPISKAVISVPAYFNANQRQATINAGVIAGLNVVSLINEPTAAALAYGFGRSEFDKDKTILVYDLGGGTFDVSIVNISSNDFFVRATTGDSNLGGQDFTNQIVKHCVKDINRKHGIEIKKHKISFSRLTEACEVVKKRLTIKNCQSADIRIMSICKNRQNTTVDYSITITRKQFEEWNSVILNRTMDLVQNCLKDARLTVNDIDEVLLVGGSTRIPKVQQIVENYFSPQKVNKILNPDEAVALGAAIQGAILRGDSGPKFRNRVLFDVTPLSLGTDVEDYEMNIIIKRNTLIPVRKTERYWTLRHNQTSVHCGIYQGERASLNDNIFLGEFNLIGLRKAPRGEVKVDVTFDINTNGILSVTAQEVSADGSPSRNIESITIKNSISRLKKAEIKTMIETARRLEATDAKFIKKSMIKSKLERYAHDADQYLSLKSTKEKLNHSIHEECSRRIEKMLNILSKQENRELREYEDLFEDLEEFIEAQIGDDFFKDNNRTIGEQTPMTTSDLSTSKTPPTKYNLD